MTENKPLASKVLGVIGGSVLAFLALFFILIVGTGFMEAYRKNDFSDATIVGLVILPIVFFAAYFSWRIFCGVFDKETSLPKWSLWTFGGLMLMEIVAVGFTTKGQMPKILIPLAFTAGCLYWSNKRKK